jgi:hypothetical protein
MGAAFRKGKVAKPKRTPAPAPAKRPPPNHGATPNSRSGDGTPGHNTVTTRTFFILVDTPKLGHEMDRFLLESPPRPMRKVEIPDAEPTHSSLVSVLAFEHVPDSGKLKLTFERGDDRAPVVLFQDVDAKDPFLWDADLIVDAAKKHTLKTNLRVLDYHAVEPRPETHDYDLEWPWVPYEPLVDEGG